MSSMVSTSRVDGACGQFLPMATQEYKIRKIIWLGGVDSTFLKAFRWENEVSEILD